MEGAAVDVLKEKEIKRWLGQNDAMPTVVVLTDGFNNLGQNDSVVATLIGSIIC